MAKTAHIWTNFRSGEISPLLGGRPDMELFLSGCRTLQNYLVLPHGGVTRRPGTRFIAEVKDSSKATRIIPFIFSEEQAYILELGNLYIRFFFDQGQLMSGASPLEIVSPYTDSQLAEVNFVQSADVMYFVHPDVQPYKLSRTSHTSWSMAPLGVANQPADWGSGNWPRCVCFYEQRLWFANIADRPQTLWASKSGDYEDFAMGTGADDDAVEYTISSDYVNGIQWLVPHKVLMVGTLGSEWTCGASSILDPVTPTNVRFTREATVGSATQQARLIHHAIVFVGQQARKCWELRYSYEQDGYNPSDISIHSEHLARAGLGFFDYQQDPLSITWFVRKDGDLVGCSYNRVESVIAWHHHTTQGEFEDVAVIPGADRDEVWVLVKRTVGGSDYRFVELMQAPFGMGGGPSDIKDAFFVDSGLSYSGTPQSTFSGLDHLNGEEVAILADGSPHTPQVVDGGQITLAWEASDVHAGLQFDSILETMPIEAGAQDGVAQGKQKRIIQAIIRMVNTVGIEVGTKVGNKTNIVQRKTSDYMDTAVPLETGDKQISMGSGWERDGRIYVYQELPLPSTITAIIAEVATEGMTAQDN